MSNTVKTIFEADGKPHQKVQSQIQRDMEKYQRDQERREKDITRAFEREAQKRQAQEQKLLREAERDQARMVRERERQEKEITRMTLQEIRLREQAQREAEADAKFRARELENFRQGIVARQGGISNQPTGVWNRLSGYQKTQLSFQANDVISGLAMGQSPFQIAAQQGGQILQIFQQTKEAQEGITKASTASATAQKIFAANSKEAALEIAKGHQSITLLGTSAIGLGAIAAAGLVTIGAVYQLTKDIEAAAKTRLATEEQITGELNKQRLAQINFLKERQKAQAERESGRFMGSAGVFWLNQARAEREKELAKLVQEVDRETQVRGAALSAVGGFKDEKKREAFLNPKELEASKTRIEELREQLKNFDKAIDDRGVDLAKMLAAPSSIIQGAMDRAASVRAQIEQDAVAASEAATKALERVLNKRNATVAELQKGLVAVMRQGGIGTQKRDELIERFNNEIEQAVERQKKKLEELKKAREEAFQIGLSTQDSNPFLDQLSNTEKRMQSMLQTTKDLGSAIRNALAGQILNQSERQLRGLRLDAQLDAIGLREQARDFSRGYRQGDENEILRQAKLRLKPNYFTQEGRESALQREIQKQRELVEKEKMADLDKRLRLLNTRDPIANAKLVQLAQSIDPARLNYQQRSQITGAFEREADRKLNSEKAAVDFYAMMTKIVSEKGMKVDLNGQAITTVDVKSKGITVEKQTRSVYGNPVSTADSMNP